ncbi:hypothetical protein P7C70_g1853, partial [Phenoliferia sp. Uapishka_3]
MDYVRVPLSTFDMNNVDSIGLWYGFVLDTNIFDAAPLNAAASRLVKKWRLLAGRIEPNQLEVRSHPASQLLALTSCPRSQGPTEAPWSISVPTGSLSTEFKTHSFNITHLPTTPIDTPTPVLGPSDCALLPRPSLEYFSKAGTPIVPKDFVKVDPPPFLSIQVTVLSNATCVGVTLPHLVFDAFGAGMVVQALDAELNGRDWVVPAIQISNPITEAYERHFHEGHAPEGPGTAMERVRKTFISISVLRILPVIWRLFTDTTFRGATSQALYIGPEVVKQISERAKADAAAVSAKEGGKTEYISTYDALLAFFLKASYLNEPTRTNALQLTMNVAFRQLLSSALPLSLSGNASTLEQYPHNAYIQAVTPFIPIHSLSSHSVGSLALILRRTVLEARTIPSFVTMTEFYSDVKGGLPIKATGADLYSTSGHVDSKVNEINFGVPILSCWFHLPPFLPPGAFGVNKHPNGGFVFLGCQRRCRWEAIQSEIERMQQGLPMKVL